MIIQTGDSIRGMDVPVITGVKLDNVLLGDFTQKENVKLALQFLGALSLAEFRSFLKLMWEMQKALWPIQGMELRSDWEMEALWRNGLHWPRIWLMM